MNNICIISFYKFIRILDMDKLKIEIENYKYSGSLFNIKTNIKGLYAKQFNI